MGATSGTSPSEDVLLCADGADRVGPLDVDSCGCCKLPIDPDVGGCGT